MTQCTVCDRKAQLFLCPTCTIELRALFVGMPRWLTYLRQTAYGQARMPDDGRHTRSRTYRLDGDAEVSSFGTRTLAVFLAAGRVNLKAVTLLDSVTAMLTTWARHIAETRKVEVGEHLCDWLARNVAAIAADEAAAEIYRDVTNAVASIERVINPPIPPRLCGPCPAVDGHGHICGIRLMAMPKDTTVRCPRCDTVHDVDTLIRKLMDDVDWYPMSVQELGLALAAIGQPVPVKTIYDWTYKGRLEPCGHKDGKPLFRLSDARQLGDKRRKVG